MKVLVTGASGFIGTNLVNLIKKKVDVVALDKAGIRKNSGNVRSIRVDLERFNGFPSEIDEIDVVVHLAAETRANRLLDGIEQFYGPNVTATQRLLEAIRKQNRQVTLIHVSTNEVFGPVLEGQDGFSADAALNPFKGKRFRSMETEINLKSGPSLATPAR
jgi:nucleoside-diphosphate-sugar epimerase